jgi:peptidoglycan-associated lipoprotein
MLDVSRPRLALACLAAAALAGCATTPHVEVPTSQAVLEARELSKAPPPPDCPEAALDTVSPTMVGFPFDEATVGEAESLPLVGATKWLACHPATLVVIRPEGDAHGTVAQQDTLARARADAVRDYLTTQGVAAGRIRTLGRAQAEPGGEHFLIRAEGRRW